MLSHVRTHQPQCFHLCAHGAGSSLALLHLAHKAHRYTAMSCTGAVRHAGWQMCTAGSLLHLCVGECDCGRLPVLGLRGSCNLPGSSCAHIWAAGGWRHIWCVAQLVGKTAVISEHTNTPSWAGSLVWWAMQPCAAISQSAEHASTCAWSACNVGYPSCPGKTDRLARSAGGHWSRTQDAGGCMHPHQVASSSQLAALGRCTCHAVWACCRN